MNFHGDVLEILSYTYGSTEKNMWIQILIATLLPILRPSFNSQVPKY